MCALPQTDDHGESIILLPPPWDGSNPGTRLLKAIETETEIRLMMLGAIA
jgi:hypothetical protein